MQLLPIRELYQTEARKIKSWAVFWCSSRWDIGKLRKRKIKPRITGDEFHKAVIAEATKWEFQDVVPEGPLPASIVREGMDITTLISWEKRWALPKAKPLSTAPATAPSRKHIYRESFGGGQRTKQATASSPPRPKGPRYWPN
jgi:hypothetical protein